MRHLAFRVPNTMSCSSAQIRQPPACRSGDESSDCSWKCQMPHDITRIRDRNCGPEQLVRHRRIGQPLSSSRCLLSCLALFWLRYSEGLSPVICLKTRRNADESP